MQCPIDGTQLKMADRSGVEIDYCPRCRGVWLDRGELDKIIERAGTAAPRREPVRPAQYGHDGHRTKRKSTSSRLGGLLDDIFDF